MEKYYILTFQNTLGAINGESVLKEKKIKVEIMPTPTAITKSCGISIKINCENIDKIQELLSNKEINVRAIYFKDDMGYSIFEF
jgi:hypothetical protein